MDDTDNVRYTYRTYLLRLWREGQGAPWRATLRTPEGERDFHFATLEALFAFLGRQLDDGWDAPLSEA